MDELIRELKRQGVLKSSYAEAAFRAIDRKRFIREENKEEAYRNHPLSIGHGQTISQPYTVAFMLDLLDPKPGERILDIGSGSGWQTALLAHTVTSEGKPGTVVAIERIPELAQFAKENIDSYGFIKQGVVKLISGDATQQLGRAESFDGTIAAAASSHAIPETWKAVVRPGGRIVSPVDDSIRRYTKHVDGTWSEEVFPGFAFVPLVSQADKNHEEHRENKIFKQPRRFRSYILCIFCIIFIFSTILVYVIFVPKNIPRSEIEIANGMGSRKIGTLLKSRGLIRSKWAFVAYATVTGKASLLKPGTYEFVGSLTMPHLIDDLVRGQTNERIITIPEGWDLNAIASYFEANNMFSGETLWSITGYPPSVANSRPRKISQSYTSVFPFLAGLDANATLEGFLFPDTYRLYRTASSSDVVKTMLANFETKVVRGMGEDIATSRKTLLEIITMASLIEKEVITNEDQSLVAGILWKRLEHGIPLQVDATVSYVTGKSGTPNAQDLKRTSLYNTYLHRGLPPGPIANPGLRAIRASLHPTVSPYLYYLSRPDGVIVYSRTLEEHNTAKARYLR